MAESKAASGCLSGFASCLKNTASIVIYGDEIIEIVELANPNPVDKAIMNSIQAILKVSAKALLALSKACSDKAAEIDKKDQEQLKELGLLKKDGSVSSLVSDVVNQTISVSHKP